MNIFAFYGKLINLEQIKITLKCQHFIEHFYHGYFNIQLTSLFS